MAHKVVGHASKVVLEACRLHQLIVLGAPQRREHVEAEPLGLGHELVIDKLGEDSSKGGLGGLEELAKAEDTVERAKTEAKLVPVQKAIEVAL